MSTSLAKKEIMANRKPKAVEVVPVNKTHEVYLKIKELPEQTEEDYRKVLVRPGSDISNKDINNALRNLTASGHLIQTTRGRGANKYTVYKIDETVVYAPKPIMRKIAPHDTKALKSVAKSQTPRQQAESLFAGAPDPVADAAMNPIAESHVGSSEIGEAPAFTKLPKVPKPPKRPTFEIIQGFGALDANNPVFKDEAAKVIEKLGGIPEPLLPWNPNPETKIVEGIFIKLGGQDVVVSLAEFAQLYSEIRVISDAMKK
jgi:hypothetical protein